MKNHRVHKKKLIPNFLDVVDTRFPGISWSGQKVPEIIWLSFVANRVGRKSSIELAVKFAKVFLSIKNDFLLTCFFPSTISKLDDKECSLIRTQLKDIGIYDQYLLPVSEFCWLFPDCPLTKVFEDLHEGKPDVDLLKNLMLELSNPISKETVFTFGTIVFSMMATRRINIPPQSPMGRFEFLNDYPDTLESKMLASGIRATINICFNPDFYDYSNNWIQYFSNKCYSYEPIRL